MISVRRSTFQDHKDFGELVLISAPYFPILFGDKVRTLLQDLFRCHSNLFSFEHVYFSEVDGKKSGMILGYDWKAKKRENLRTGFLLFKKIGVSILGKSLSLKRFNATVGRVYDGTYYISNIATYPQYRGRGVGKRLMLEAEREAKMVGAEGIVLDVEEENIGAIKFYKGLGYEMIEHFSIPLQRGKILHFNRMKKETK